jgi:peptidoglycan/LPS O-acetylase OafA/YrhL
MPDQGPTRSNRDWIYRLASALAILEGLVVAGLGLFLILNSFLSDVSEPSAWLAEIAFAALGATGLIAAGYGLKRRKNWGRAPVVIANLIALPVAYYLWTSDQKIVALILGAIAVPALLSSFLAIPQR